MPPDSGERTPYQPTAYQPPGYQPPAYGPPSYGQIPPYGQAPQYGQPPYGQVPYGPGQAPYGQGQPPYGQQPPVHPGMLAAAADRERTMDVLKAAFGEGRITKEEFDLRASRTMSARTYAQLGAVVADLPSGPSFGVLPYQHGYYPVVTNPTSGLAIGALVCGIAEIFTLGFAAIPAVILGHLARQHIRQTGERGDGMAIAGLVLGYLGIGIWTLIIIALAAHS
ncbi:MAG TPA: DUF4190 domain-containing protein [Trebonia sp.]|jgi:hypothetical protein|nr:DUF4190 domain-containing protein [Trebonia sp.]